MDYLRTGEVIGKRRKELGLTQNQLAQFLNISFQAVSKWENRESLKRQSLWYGDCPFCGKYSD